MKAKDGLEHGSHFQLGMNTATASVSIKKNYTDKDIRSIHKFLSAVLERKRGKK